MGLEGRTRAASLRDGSSVKPGVRLEILSNRTYNLTQERPGRFGVSTAAALLIHEIKDEESKECRHDNSHAAEHEEQQLNLH